MDEELTNDATTLAELMSLAAADPVGWPADELPALWRHQLDTPLISDLVDVAPNAAQCISTWCQLSGTGTFGDVLSDPSPPIQILRLIKDFAKSRTAGVDASPLQELAIALYYAVIAVALVRCGLRITDLPDASLLKGFGWAAACAWLDDRTRASLREAVKRLPVKECD